MLEPGRIHQLVVASVDERGIWFATDAGPLLLPRRDATAAVEPGESLPVFLFRDSSGELRASLQLPSAQIGEFAYLQVRTVGVHGAFLDWGVEKDLLVPPRLQPKERMQPGRRYLVRVALDPQGRPYASARLDDWLEESCHELSNGAAVSLVAWQFTDLGVKVIVNHRWIGLLYRDEQPAGLRIGASLSGWVKRVREDGRLDITLRRVGAEGVDEAKAILLEALRRDLFLPLHDGSSPETIKQALGLSKKSFKRAVGGLYKDGVVELSATGVRLKE